MRKSLPKTSPSESSSRATSPSAGLLAAAAGRRGAAKAHGIATSNGTATSNGAAKSNGVASGLRLVDTVDRGDRFAARLRLLEGLLSRTQIPDCAQLALQWLGEVLRLRESICLVRTGGEPSLSMVASYGLPHAAASAFSLSLDDWSSPLVGALLNRTHIHYGAAHSALDRRRRPSTPFEDAAFHVVPLGVSGFAGEAVGLLLFAGASPLGSEQQWFTSVFGQKIDQILRQQAVSEGDRNPGHGQSLLHSIINAVADPIVVTDAGGGTSLTNEPAERLFTSPVRASATQRRRVQANDAHFSSFIADMLVSADEWRTGEVGLMDPHTGEAMPVEAIAGKILSDEGELTAVVTILHDRREALEKAGLYEQLKAASGELERKIQAATADIAQQNELLRRQAIELEQASALKSQFLANMSHEFRTPLNAMLGYTSMLLQGVAGSLEPPVRRQLGRIESNGRHLLTIINEILDISRLEAGRVPLRVTTFEIPELVAEVASELEPLIKRSKLALTLDLPKDLRPISTDRQKVKQILLNLLSNALKFTHQGASWSARDGYRPSASFDCRCATRASGSRPSIRNESSRTSDRS